MSHREGREVDLFLGERLNAYRVTMEVWPHVTTSQAFRAAASSVWEHARQLLVLGEVRRDVVLPALSGEFNPQSF